MRIEAKRELLASRRDAWAFVAEPYHLADWWPGIAGVRPDRRGLAAGARWEVFAGPEPTLLRRPRAEQVLVVTRVAEPELLAFELVADRLAAELRLDYLAENRTRATLALEAPLLLGYRRSLARRALTRLHDLCQTAAAL